LYKAVADDSIKAIVLICAGRTFIAGADISEMGNPNIPSGLSFLEVFDTFEYASKPIVAAIHGTALGGELGTRSGLPLSDRGFFRPTGAARGQAWAGAGRRRHATPPAHRLGSSRPRRWCRLVNRFPQ